MSVAILIVRERSSSLETEELLEAFADSFMSEGDVMVIPPEECGVGEDTLQITAPLKKAGMFIDFAMKSRREQPRLYIAIATGAYALGGVVRKAEAAIMVDMGTGLVMEILMRPSKPSMYVHFPNNEFEDADMHSEDLPTDLATLIAGYIAKRGLGRH